jgi:hypothetical protein
MIKLLLLSFDEHLLFMQELNEVVLIYHLLLDNLLKRMQEHLQMKLAYAYELLK